MNYIFKAYEKEVEKKVLFMLENEGDVVYLKAVDDKGKILDSGYILEISPNGITLCKRVNPEIGLPLDSKGMVKIINKES